MGSDMHCTNEEFEIPRYSGRGPPCSLFGSRVLEDN
jgi:hypothetical protein